MNKKTLAILLIALLLVGVLFIVSLVLAGRPPKVAFKIGLDSPDATRISGWISRPAEARYLTLVKGSPADCQIKNNQIFIRQGASCVYSVATDKMWTRKLRLQLQPTPTPTSTPTRTPTLQPTPTQTAQAAGQVTLQPQHLVVQPPVEPVIPPCVMLEVVKVTLIQTQVYDVERTLAPGQTSDSFDIYGHQNRQPASLEIQSVCLPLLSTPEPYTIEIKTK